LFTNGLDQGVDFVEVESSNTFEKPKNQYCKEQLAKVLMVALR
jgi:hypothetical protein